MANPYYTLWLVNSQHYDQLTLVLAGLALAAVLGAWAMLGEKTPGWQRTLYFCFLLLAFVFSMAGSTYLIISGGTQ
jgi:hypothetical protein